MDRTDRFGLAVFSAIRRSATAGGIRRTACRFRAIRHRGRRLDLQATLIAINHVHPVAENVDRLA